MCSSDLAAERGQLPELKRVILAFGNAIAMEENLELSIQRVFGGDLLRQKEVPQATVEMPMGAVRSDRSVALEALNHYRKAQENLRQGNWRGYGEELRQMSDLLQSLERNKMK